MDCKDVITSILNDDDEKKTRAILMKSLMTAQHTDVIVYCYAENKYDHKDMIQKIKNVEVIIGRGELIRKTGTQASLKFVNL